MYYNSGELAGGRIGDDSERKNVAPDCILCKWEAHPGGPQICKNNPVGSSTIQVNWQAGWRNPTDSSTIQTLTGLCHTLALLVYLK